MFIRRRTLACVVSAGSCPRSCSRSCYSRAPTSRTCFWCAASVVRVRPRCDPPWGRPALGWPVCSSFESLLLAGFGGGVGLLITRWAVVAIPSLPFLEVAGRSMELSVDLCVALCSVALMASTGILFGLTPAIRSVRTDVARTLRDDRRGASGGRGANRLQSLLVAVQVAASLILVLGTGLLARSLTGLQNVDTGVDDDRIAYLRDGLEACWHRGRRAGPGGIGRPS